MTQDIIENNKLIADFMGGKMRYFVDVKRGQWIGQTISDTPFELPFSADYSVSGKQLTFPRAIQHFAWHLPPSTLWKFDEWLKYHSSWEWLMPVVEKIEQGLFAVEIKENHCHITGYRKHAHVDFYTKSVNKDKRQATYECIVDFVKWYNSLDSTKQQ